MKKPRSEEEIKQVMLSWITQLPTVAALIFNSDEDMTTEEAAELAWQLLDDLADCVGDEEEPSAKK